MRIKNDDLSLLTQINLLTLKGLFPTLIPSFPIISLEKSNSLYIGRSCLEKPYYDLSQQKKDSTFSKRILSNSCSDRTALSPKISGRWFKISLMAFYAMNFIWLLVYL